MNYSVTAKSIKPNIPTLREIWNQHDTLALMRKVFIRAGRSDDSADIQALAMMNKIDNGEAQVMRNEKNGHAIIFQLHVENS